MPPLTLQLLIAALTAAPFIALYWGARFVSRRRLAWAFRELRVWQPGTVQRWLERGWLDSEATPESLPGEISPARVFYEWARADPEAAGEWRFRETPRQEMPVEAIVELAWEGLPEASQARGRERLAAALVEAGAWWGGAERGWNGRPLVVVMGAAPRHAKGLPLLPMDDLTAAPLPAPVRVQQAAEEAEGPDLVLLLAALRRWSGRFRHPLAPRADATGSLIEGMGTRLATDVGRRVGASLGAVLGPVGSMIGQHLGGVVGSMGGKALAQQSLPAPVSEALKQTESALVRLGKTTESDALARAAGAPARQILELGGRLERARDRRSRGLRERFWPTAGLGCVEEVMRLALEDLTAYRAAVEPFVKAARNGNAAVAGGMLLQNPWLARELPGAAERLTEARAALNRAAIVIRNHRPG